jgi:hypothetical protein
MNKFIESSTDPKKLSLTVESPIYAIPAVVVAVLKMLDVDVAESEVASYVQAVSFAVAALSGVLGATRKFYFRVEEAVNAKPTKNKKK